MPDNHVGILRNIKGVIIDACSFEINDGYLWQLERCARTMKNGDTLSVHTRRMTKAEEEEATKQRDAKRAESLEAERGERIAAYQVAIDKLNGGADLVAVENELSEAIPF